MTALYLTCAKFVTTPEYAPRLRTRPDIEQQLVQDADERGWTREAERHTAISHDATSTRTGRPARLWPARSAAPGPHRSCHRGLQG